MSVSAYVEAFGPQVSQEQVAPVTGIQMVRVQRLSSPEQQHDWVAQEVPVALVYNGISHAVMMATPRQLEEFALGFSLAEAIVPDASHIYDMTVSQSCGGYQVDMTVSSESFCHLKEHRRSMEGRTGCGLCGKQSLEAVLSAVRPVARTQTFDLCHLNRALEYLTQIEVVGSMTGCTHAAVWVRPDGTLAGGAEDVGRHVALDKLLGLRERSGWRDGALFLSSRASYEMVQKAARCGVETVFAVSAPTALAIELAQQAGVTLAAFCRRDRANVYTHGERLRGLGERPPSSVTVS